MFAHAREHNLPLLLITLIIPITLITQITLITLIILIIPITLIHKFPKISLSAHKDTNIFRNFYPKLFAFLHFLRTFALDASL